MMNMLWQPYSHTKVVKALRAEELGEKKTPIIPVPHSDRLTTHSTESNCDSSTDKY